MRDVSRHAEESLDQGRPTLSPYSSSEATPDRKKEEAQLDRAEAVCGEREIVGPGCVGRKVAVALLQCQRPDAVF